MKNLISVELIILVECTDNWGDDCTIGQVKKQSKEEAIKLATRALQKDPLVKSIKTGEVKISTNL